MARRSVMISSTARDLPKHRDEVRLACLRAAFDPREMMENLPALNKDAIDASLRMVDEADVYLCILAYRYGTVPEGYEIAITEMEFNRAVELNKPRLVFFIHKDHPVLGGDIETGSGATKLEALKVRIGEHRVAAFFKSPEDLRASVIEALSELAKELDKAQTGDAVARVRAQLHRTTSIPAPPEPYIAHPYTLLQTRDLVGRQTELNALTGWVANPAASAFGARVFCFVAIGGMGKSALTWKWLNQIAPNEMKPLVGRLWWSFYESDASFENFLIRALCYVSGQGEEEVRRLPWPEREAQLLQHLNEKPYLFVLDGLERILTAYHRMDASYLADDEYDQRTANWVVGAVGLPASAAQSFVGQHRLRQTTDPRAGAFLQKLAQIANSRILITTRLYPSALQLPNGQPRPGCFAYSLRGLYDDDALDLWRALNVTGSRAELLPIFRSVESHPLLVQALASEVANYRKAPGDFAQWQADHPQFDPTSLSLVQSRTHILEFALNGLSTEVRQVMNMLVGFRMPASYPTLEALLVGPDKACDSAKELDRALTELEDRGLIGWDRVANRYDVHPIVRGVVWQLTDAKDQHAVYAALEAHFEPMGMPDYESIETIADLTPTIEHFYTLVGLARYDDAFALFRDRLEGPTLFRLAAHRERITLLEGLFPDGVERVPALTSDRAQSYTLSALAASYNFSGQPGRSVATIRLSCKLAEHAGDALSLNVALSNQCIALREVGALREALAAQRRALALDRELQDEHRESFRLRELGRVMTSTGAYADGLVALGRGFRIAVACRLPQSECVCSAYLAEMALWVGDLKKAEFWAQGSWRLAAVQRFERDFIRAALVQGRVALGADSLSQADERLHYALIRSRAANVVEFELPALIAIAELELKRGNPAKARASLEDIWEVAERGPYPLHQADAFNVLAAIALAEGDKPTAVAAATHAFKAAWCDGSPYAYHWGLQKAEAQLAALGASEPVLPPFDQSKFEPMPEVEINPKDKYWLDPASLD
jgi:hypothetical protein